MVKADGYGHGMLPVGAGGAAGGRDLAGGRAPSTRRWRCGGPGSPRRCWPGCSRPGCRCAEAVAADVELVAGPARWPRSPRPRAAPAGRPGCTSSSTPAWPAAAPTAADWPALVEAAAKAQADGAVEVVGVWSHLAYADVPGHPTIDASWPRSSDAARRWPSGPGCDPRYRHLANSAATLTRPDTHFDLVRPGIAVYGLSPVPGGADSGCGRR